MQIDEICVNCVINLPKRNNQSTILKKLSISLAFLARYSSAFFHKKYVYNANIG